MVQFTFENAGNLWFLLALPLLVFGHFWFLRHAKKRSLRFANFRALKRITGKRLMTNNYLVLFLRLFTLLFLILAVSGTVLWYEGESNSNDFVIAVDSSSSMSSQDISPTRFEAAKSNAKLFIDALDSEARIGVVSFAGVSLIESVPNDNKEGVKSVIDSLELLESGGTDIPGAIITSTNLLLDNSKGRAIILITDGSSTIESFLDKSVQRALAYAKEHHVTINAVGIGTDMGPVGYLPTFYNVSAVYDEQTLLQITNSTGGVYSHAESTNELLDAFQNIADKTNEQLLRRDLRPFFMLLALLFLFVEWILVNTRFRSLP